MWLKLYRLISRLCKTNYNGQLIGIVSIISRAKFAVKEK